MVMFRPVDYPLILTSDFEVFTLKVKYCTEPLHFSNESLYLAFVFYLFYYLCFFNLHLYSLIWTLEFEVFTSKVKDAKTLYISIFFSLKRT